MCVLLTCVYVHHVCAGTPGCQKRVLDSLKLRLGTVVSRHVVMGTELGSPVRVGTALGS